MIVKTRKKKESFSRKRSKKNINLNKKHNTTRVNENLIKKILMNSKSTDFIKALLEWTVTGYQKKEHIDGSENHNCHLCGQDELLHIFSITNVKTKKTISNVGSHCIFRHFAFNKQLKDIMRFLENNIHKRKLLYGKYKGMKIIDVLKKDPDYILQEVEVGNEFHEYLRSNTLTKKQIDTVTVSLQCMEILHMIHVRGKYIHIDNANLEDYLNNNKSSNPYHNNYKRIHASQILDFIRIYNEN